MSKYTVTTRLDGVKIEDGQFSWREEIVSMKWMDPDFGPDQLKDLPEKDLPDYSYRKKYQLGHGNESPSPLLKEYLDNVKEFDKEEDERSLYFDYWQPRRKKNGL